MKGRGRAFGASPSSNKGDDILDAPKVLLDGFSVRHPDHNLVLKSTKLARWVRPDELSA